MKTYLVIQLMMSATIGNPDGWPQRFVVLGPLAEQECKVMEKQVKKWIAPVDGNCALLYFDKETEK